MPLTPETWLEEFTVNITTAGTQSRPQITQLTNGNILVVWDSTDDSGAGSDPGVDLIGQIFDPLGNLVGAEFQVNSSFFADDERNASVDALPGGGFITVYEDLDATTRSIRLIERDATGAVVSSNTTVIGDITGSADPTFFNPQVVVGSATSILVVWQEAEVGGDSRIAGRIYDSTTDTYGAEISLINFAGSNTAPVITVLTNGNYVIASATTQSDGDQVISYRIINSAGANVLGVTEVTATVDDTHFDREPSVTALTGGDFVITWTNTDSNDTDIEFQRYNAAGVAQGGLITVTTIGATDNGNESTAVALQDGGFIVFYDEDGLGELRGRRFDSAGNGVGSTFTVAAGGGGIDEIDAVLLEDGRVAVTFERANGEIGMEILDTRDAPNDPGVYTPNQFQIGTVGDDEFTADGNSEFVYGHDGNDRITESGQVRSYFGGTGNDTLLVVSPINSDVHDGGIGTDSIDWSGSFVSGGTFDLGLGTATSGTSTEQMISFENLTGTTNADTIIGSVVANILNGGGDNDTITGQGGNDTVSGGAGNDLVNHTIGLDTYDGGADNDTLASLDVSYASGAVIDLEAGTFTFGATTLNWTNFENWRNSLVGDSFEEVRGTAGANLLDFAALTAGSGIIADGRGGNDTLNGSLGGDTFFGGSGNDTLNGGAGIDTLAGGADNDTYFIGSASDVIIEGAGQGLDDRLASNTNYVLAAGVQIERMTTTTSVGVTAINLTGNELAQSIIGNAGENTLNDGGGAGADTLTGLGDDDIYIVRNAGSVIVEGAGQGTADRVSAGVSFALAADDNIEILTTTSSGAAVAINLTGNALAQAITGNAGLNTLSDGGGAGADTLTGLAGNDIYVVRNAGSVIVEGAGQGTADRVSAGVSFALAADDNIEILTTTSSGGITAINLTGNALAQAITGNDGTNVLHDGGAGGSDTLTGRAGDDTYRVFNAGTVIVEGAGGGTNDRVTAALSFALAADDNIELLTTNSSAAVTAINLTGNALAQTIVGNAGVNILSDGGGAGADTISGLGGNDIYVIRNAGTQINESAGNGTADRVSAGVSFVLAADDNIEIMTTTSSGGTTAINLTGNALIQTITGNNGANRLNGLGGSDTMTGGGGADTFVFNTALGAANVDRITDFNVAADAFELENAIFVGLGNGALAASAFRANLTGQAADASDRIIYETDTGNVFFDSDGTGATARVRFAVIDTGLGLTAADFFVV